MTRYGLSRRGVVLVGYRGTGKTTVGRILADRLGFAFRDADLHVEALAGRTIASIFAEEGEQVFRDFEETVVADLTKEIGAVIATGGGAILRSTNREAIRAVGFVVWLKADPETLARRLRRDQTRLNARPALTSAGTLDEIGDVLAARTPLYRDVADIEVDTVDRSSFEVALDILQAWTACGSGETSG